MKQKNPKYYLSLIRMGILEAMQYRLGIVIMIIGNLLYLIVVYFLWKAIFASSIIGTVNGMTFTDTLIYLVLAAAIFNFMEMYDIVWHIGNCIRSGNIVLELLKPIQYKKYLFWFYSGRFVINFLFTFLPTFIIVIMLTKGEIKIGINLLFFMISILMSVFINYCIDFFVGTICFYTESIWGINIMKQVIVLLLSGATIPLAFFPTALRNIAYYLPFQSIYNAPLSLLINGNVPIKEIIFTLVTQFVWCVLASVISNIFWKISMKKITVNGG